MISKFVSFFVVVQSLSHVQVLKHNKNLKSLGEWGIHPDFYNNPITPSLFVCHSRLIHLQFIFTYLSRAALGLHCFVRAFSICSKERLLFVATRRLLISVSSCHRTKASGTPASGVVVLGPRACGLRELWRTGSGVAACGLWSAHSTVVAHGL